MTRVEWWYELERGFVAHAELLPENFTTHVAGRRATIYLPSVSANEGNNFGWLAAPRIDQRPATPPNQGWGMVYASKNGKPVNVIISQLAFTAELSGGVDEQQTAESLVDAMDAWWDNVRGWLELVTGQHLTRVGHKPPQYIGSKSPIWALQADGTHGQPFSIPGSASISLGRKIPAVTGDILRSCASLADQSPPLAWMLLRDAHALRADGHYRRSIIDAATAAELAVSEILDSRLAETEQSVRTALLSAHRMLGPRSKLLTSLGCPPLPSSFEPDLVVPRNSAVHKGVSVDEPACRRAVSVAAEVVERAYPLPVAPGTDAPLRRLW